MTSGQLNANVEQYLQAAAMNVAPPQILSDPLVTGMTPVEQLLRVLGLAANLGDPKDNADSIEEHAKRDAKATDAAEKFAAQDDEAAQELDSIAADSDLAAPQAQAPAADQSAAMAQQMPQAVSGIAGALSGALGGALQPLTQIPQQLTQGAQQAMQSGMGLFQQTASPVDDAGLTSLPVDEFDSVPPDFDDLSGGGGGAESGGMGESPGLGGGDFGGGGGPGAGLMGGTAPTSLLGPPPVPSASTAPSSAPLAQIAAAGTPPGPAPSGAGMAGMPMVPPGSMAGASGADKDAKTDTRRVSVPPVRNGAPVQGRLATPSPLPPVTRKIDGAPVVTRRVVIPGGKTDDDAPSER